MPGSKETYRETPVIQLNKEKTFDYFFRQYYAALCFFAQSIIHRQEDAKDIVQDCFLKLWDDETITGKANSVKSFLYAMVRNRCIDYLRKQKLNSRTIDLMQKAEDDFEYFDELAFAEMMRQVLDNIATLPETMATILNEHYLKGRKYKDIAKQLSTTPNAVKLQKARAVKLLKQKLTLFLSLLFIFLLFILS